MTAFATAVEALHVVEGASPLDDAQATRVGDLAARPAYNRLGRARQPEPCELENLTRSRWGSSLTICDAAAPVVVVGWRWVKLPRKGWQDGHIWTAGGWLWEPESQPHGPPLYPKAARVNLAGGDSWEPSEGTRGLSLAVLDDPAAAEPTIDGTRALVIAVTACEVAAEQLRTAVDVGDIRDRTARLYRAEADALTEHAAACEARIDGSLAWWGDYRDTLPPVQPFPPVVAAQLRGYITVSPIT